MRTRQWTFVLWTFVVACGIPGAATAQSSGIPERVSALEQQVQDLQRQLTEAFQPANIDVNCDNGERLNDALFKAGGSANRAIITVYGTCVERVVLSRSNTILLGGSDDAGILAPDSKGPALTVNGAHRVFLVNLAVSGGMHTLRIDGGAYVFANAVNVSGGTGFGVFVAHGSAQIANSTIENNGADGIFAWSGSRVVLNGGVIRGNRSGLRLADGATASLDFGSQITDNRELGLGLGAGAVANIRQATVERNSRGGVRVAGGSIATLGNPSQGRPVIRNNGGHGITIEDASMLMAIVSSPGGSMPEISGNSGLGVFCDLPTEPHPQVALSRVDNPDGTNCPVP